MTFVKECGGGCGKKIFWNTRLMDNPKIRWCEVDTRLLHDFKRCAELLKEQGKDVGVLKGISKRK